MMNIQKKKKGHANRETAWRQAGIGKRRLTETHWQVQRARIIFVTAGQVKRYFNVMTARRATAAGVDRLAAQSALPNIKERQQTQAEHAPRSIY